MEEENVNTCYFLALNLENVATTGGPVTCFTIIVSNAHMTIQ